MPLSNHTVSLSLSLALRDSGYPQEGSLFYWSDWYKEGEYSLGYGKSPGKVRHTKPDGTFVDRVPDTLAAPLASELMDVLPDGYFPVRVKNVWNTGLLADFENIEGWGSEDMHAGTLSDALAKLWLHIHSQKII